LRTVPDLSELSPEAGPTATPGSTPGVAFPTDRILLRAAFGQDEANYDTVCYPVDADGLVRIPRAAADPLIERGGFAELKIIANAASAGNIRLHHDSAAGCSYGGCLYSCDENGEVLVPAEGVEELSAHGFTPVLFSVAATPAGQASPRRSLKG
jgi:hypothetical protein